MKKFYQITQSGKIITGEGYKVPQGFEEYSDDKIPDELLKQINNDKSNTNILKIKAEAEKIITSKYSIIWQLNHPRGLPEYKEVYDYIDAIRDISNKAEEDGLNVDEIDWKV
ncbi:hypothetical protein ACN9JZ_03375 [Aliarcobacter butzleri]|uniref:hypothetical protein n=1 Tax=Aliarcobacter butzleri TaxID=28197 RepID=UPI003AF6626E